MATRKVIKEETVLTGEDAENEKETTGSKEKAQQEVRIGDFVKGFSPDEANELSFRVYRQAPVNYKGQKVTGLLEDFSPPFDSMILKDKFGGGRYRIDIIKGNKTVKTIYEEIPGEPKIVFEEEDITKDPYGHKKKLLKLKLEEAQLKRAIKDLAGEDDEDNQDQEEPAMSPDEYKREIAKESARMVVRYMRKNDNTNSLSATLTALAPLLKPPDNSSLINTLLTLLAAKDNNQSSAFGPKQIMEIISPMMGEFVKGQSEIRKMEMTRVGEVQNLMFNKALDAMRLGGAKEDEVDKIRKWLPLINETLKTVGEGVGTMMNKRQQNPQLKGSQRPKLDQPKTETKEPADKEPVEENPPASEVDNRIKAYADIKPEQIIKARVDQFLLAVSKEMKIQGDPEVIYDENFEKAFYTLPAVIRKVIIESDDQPAIINAFSEYGDPDIISLIVQTAMEEKEAGIWLIDFWGIVKAVDEEKNSPDDDDNPENDDDPEPKDNANKEEEGELVNA